MELTKSKNQLVLSVIFFGIWLSLAIGSLVWLNPSTGFLSLALFAFSTLVILKNVFKILGWFQVVACMGVYAYVEFIFWGFSDFTLINVTFYFVGMVGTIITGRLVVRKLANIHNQVIRLQNMVEELIIRENTGLVRWQYALVNLKAEVFRGRRYGKPFCLFLMQIKNWDSLIKEMSEDKAEELMHDLSKQLLRALRDVDIAINYNEITLGALLPETPMIGCNELVSRILSNVEKILGISLHFGIAVFPQNGSTENEIVAAAETALNHALTHGKSIVYHQFLDDVQNLSSVAASTKATKETEEDHTPLFLT